MEGIILNIATPKKANRDMIFSVLKSYKTIKIINKQIPNTENISIPILGNCAEKL